ncbi:MAG: biotin transporter BioY, partial [Chitinispirillia bacterium]
MERDTIRNLIFTALFAALMVMGTYIRIPIGPVPVVLTNFFIFLAGLFLGSWWGMASVGLYLLMGALGLPVFSSGGGIAIFAGPTGGFLVGYLSAVFLCGLPALSKNKSIV